MEGCNEFFTIILFIATLALHSFLYSSLFWRIPSTWENSFLFFNLFWPAQLIWKLFFKDYFLEKDISVFS